FAFDPEDDAAALAGAGISVQDTVLEGFELREPYGWALDGDSDGVAAFDITGGSFAASVQGGRPLPDWLTFDAGTRSLQATGFEPDEDDQPVRVNVTFTPEAGPALPEHEYRGTEGGFTLQFLIDPADLTGALAAINA